MDFLRKGSLLFWVLTIFSFPQLFGICPCFHERFSFVEPEPFQKIYICPSQVHYHCDGTYFLNELGQLEKPRAILRDCQGLYALRIKTQCPYCGRAFLEKTPSCGHDCQLFGEPFKPYRHQNLGTPPTCASLDSESKPAAQIHA